MLPVFSRLVLVWGLMACAVAGATPFRVATFEADATPPLGAPLCGGGVTPVQSITDPLSARGVVLLPEGQDPIVICAVDWVGIGNGGHHAWRAALAKAANTNPDRVSVHVLHQHDAPYCDLTVEDLLAPQGLGGSTTDVPFMHEAMARAANAVHEAIPTAQRVTHIGLGEGVVEKVASNRRILGPDGTVRTVRWTATKDPAVQAEPVGTIDPFCKSVIFWKHRRPLAVLTWYATHPQSHYGQGQVSTDFVGMARAAREAALPGVPHIHFNGAGGNLGAGKWNDGDPANRAVLARRLEAGMRRAWEKAERIPVRDLTLDWATTPVVLPARKEFDGKAETARLTNVALSPGERVGAAMRLAWINRAPSDPITLARLRLGPLQMLMLPGELFVEYQLAAQDLVPSDFVCVAAYGDYGPCYIGTARAYAEGGYETGLDASYGGPESEALLMEGIQALLAP